MFQPVKAGFGEYMGAFYAQLSVTTMPMREFCTRGLAKSIAFVPGRMIDSVEEMLGLWQRNDNDNAPTQPRKLPVVLVAVDKDYTPTARDFTRQVVDAQWLTIPSDTKERAFKIRTIAGDIRAQVVVIAADDPTAKSIAAQFDLFIDSPSNRAFNAAYEFAGQVMDWPVMLETSDTPASNIKVEAKNLSILALDLNLHTTIPLFDAPKDGEVSDGKGAAGDAGDPSGYPVVIQTNRTAMDVEP
ncbi:hypothetical protein F6R98_10460 [Candidatus Methylospira mobilis]|uniref:Uncharacterized protein n=1 Tax=Candidatus Methylospira mobilis TaxID=1808979 RepID=A0A5Q0BL98_9GAMM|nr:hypothetical protein [Candidatus Methylospira mobilis]QFY42984.1 hypothetical protein F6R98_10460 [Candidatus Methylospira mobilis]